MAAVHRELDPSTVGDHIDRLYRAAWALCGSREDAEDLVQETYARVLSRPRLLRSDDDLGYLLRTLRNTFLRQRERSSRRPDPLAFGADVEVDRPDPRSSGHPQAALEARELYGMIARLPEEYRDVLVAVDIVGLSYKEAARMLRVRQGTVMSRLFRARDRVAEQVE